MEDPDLDEELESYEQETEAYRGRGRPKLDPALRRREKMSIAFTAEELKLIMHAAADAEGGPMRPQDWARAVLLKAAKP